MKKLGAIILAMLLVLTTVLAASCAAAPEEGKGAGNNIGSEDTKKPAEETIAPEETDAETTADEGAEKEEESALPEESETLNEVTDTAEVTEDSETTESPETEPVAPPETEPVAPPETEPVAPPETEPVAPPETEPVVPPETEPVAPPETEPVVQQPVPIDDAVLDQIAKDYYYHIMETFNSDPSKMSSRYIRRYYGTYDGAVVVVIDSTFEGNEPTVISRYEVAGYTFYYSGGSSIDVWKDGVFYSLVEAYDSGILTADQIGQINDVFLNFTSIGYDVMEHGYPN